MKKAICFIIIGVVYILMSANNYYVIPEEAIRFRIVPNSNSSKDIIMKELVKNEISSAISDMSANTIEEGRDKIISNIDGTERKIDKVFESNNYDMEYSVNYGMNEFPEKIYKGVKYPKGEYESLVVNIGDAKGDNFWCVLYPPLCMIDEDEGEVEYKFKVVEIIKKLLF